MQLRRDTYSAVQPPKNESSPVKKLLIALAVTSTAFFAQAHNQEIINLCFNSEHVLLSAKLNRITQKPNEQGYTESDSGKYVSLCGNINKDTIDTIYYRFGKLENIELEKKFEKNNPLELYPHIDHPGISNVFRFKISSYTYFLNRVYGRGMDVVSLSVKRDKNTIAKFIGRNDEVNAPIDELLFLLDVEGLSEYLGGVENISKNRILSNAIKIRSFDY